jgi:hypothetical protein
MACRKKKNIEGETKQRADYANFLTAIGGAALPRKQEAIKLAKLHHDTNRYGEPQGEKPIGIYSSDAPLKVCRSTRYMVIESVKANQEIQTNGYAKAQVILKKSGFGSTWTRVNNCTPG